MQHKLELRGENHCRRPLCLCNTLGVERDASPRARQNQTDSISFQGWNNGIYACRVRGDGGFRVYYKIRGKGNGYGCIDRASLLSPPPLWLPSQNPGLHNSTTTELLSPLRFPLPSPLTTVIIYFTRHTQMVYTMSSRHHQLHTNIRHKPRNPRLTERYS